MLHHPLRLTTIRLALLLVLLTPGTGLAQTPGVPIGWGSNEQGQINVPAGTFTAIAAGYAHSLALRTDGTLVGWGDNFYGVNSVPAGTFTAIAAGAFHSLALVNEVPVARCRPAAVYT